jgi:exodeoxyribonuclease VII small subunit
MVLPVPDKSTEKPAAKPDGAQAPANFETGLHQLEAIVKEMESGELPLERALELFERGMKLSETCRKQLEDAETRVEILMKRATSAPGEGKLQAQPFRTDKG